VVATLPGWTRGLCVAGDIIFVGVSRVLPRFKQYAPGLADTKEHCGIYAINLKTNKIVGSIEFPYGNQIFAIESVSAKITTGFPYHDVHDNPDEEKNTFLTYQV
jgi:hypothetical protein